MGANMDMRSSDRALEHRPKGFEGVHVCIAVRPNLAAMLDRPVVVPQASEDFVGRPFIGADDGPGFDTLKDRRNEGLAGSVRNDLGKQFAVTLKDTHDDGLALGTTTGEALFFALTPTADVGFVNLNVIGKRRVAVNGTHVFADFVRHPKSGRIGDAQLALQFLGGNTVARRGEQVERIEPLLQWNAGSLEHGSDHRVNVMSAPLALVGRLFANTRKLAVLVALRAVQAFAVTQLLQKFEAGAIVGKLLKEVCNGRLGHFFLHLIKKCTRIVYIGQVYNHVSAFIGFCRPLEIGAGRLDDNKC